MAIWFWYAVAAAVLYGAHQIFTRLAAERIGDGLGGFIVEASAALSILIYLGVLWFGSRWNQKFSVAGLNYSVLTGICVGASPSIMKEHDARFFMGHVLMNRDDLDGVLEQRFQHRLQFIFGHGEISIDDRVVICARKCRPGIDAHRVVDLRAVHLCRTADCEFHHSLFCFALHTKDRTQRLGRNRILFWEL